MIYDGNFQVWLDTQNIAAQTVVVPFIKTDRPRSLRYEMDVIQSGRSGNSRISQSGQIDAVATQAMPLSRVTVTIQEGGNCLVQLTLKENQQEVGVYKFDCAAGRLPITRGN